MNNVEIKMELCEGRHTTPASTSIFPEGKIEEIGFHEYNKMERYARFKINRNLDKNKVLVPTQYWDEEAGADDTKWIIDPNKNVHINVYVTGFGPALVSTINVLNKMAVQVTLWHFDKETGDYLPQALYKP